MKAHLTRRLLPRLPRMLHPLATRAGAMKVHDAHLRRPLATLGAVDAWHADGGVGNGLASLSFSAISVASRQGYKAFLNCHLIATNSESSQLSPAHLSQRVRRAMPGRLCHDTSKSQDKTHTEMLTEIRLPGLTG